MARISSNAGKHYYLRPDFVTTYNTPASEEKGLEINPDLKPFFKVVCDTGYKDKKDNNIHFKDIVKYSRDEYIVDYDGKNFAWVIKNEKRVFVLSEISSKLLIKESYNK